MVDPDVLELLKAFPRSVSGNAEMHQQAVDKLEAEIAADNITLQIAKVWAHTLAGTLAAYNLPENWMQDGTPREPLPKWIVQVLYDLLQFFIDARIPEPVLTLTKRGGAPGPGPNLRVDIGRAVAYVRAAREGIVADESPIQTIIENFKASERTVQSWLADKNWISAQDFLVGIPPEQHAQFTLDRMREAGANYAAASQSAYALKRRGKKKAIRGATNPP